MSEESRPGSAQSSKEENLKHQPEGALIEQEEGFVQIKDAEKERDGGDEVEVPTGRKSSSRPPRAAPPPPPGPPPPVPSANQQQCNEYAVGNLYYTVSLPPPPKNDPAYETLAYSSSVQERVRRWKWRKLRPPSSRPRRWESANSGSGGPLGGGSSSGLPLGPLGPRLLRVVATVSHAWRGTRRRVRTRVNSVLAQHNLSMRGRRRHASATSSDAQGEQTQEELDGDDRSDLLQDPVLQGQNGFEELRKYIKHGGDFCKELAQILQERSELESQYAKGLGKLSAKLLKASREAMGSVSQAWQMIGAQMEQQSEMHRTLASSVSEEVARPLRGVVDAQHKIRKSVEAMVDKAARNLGEWRSAEAKAKKHCYLCVRDNEKLQEHHHGGGSILSDKDVAKLESKRRKAQEAVRKADLEYYTFCVRAERARLEWDSAVSRGSHCFQTLEEERLAHLKELATRHYTNLSQMGPSWTESTERLKEPVTSCDPARDIQTVVSAKGTGGVPSEQLLPDFYAEDMTNAMNKERRRAALAKFLQMIRSDLEREWKGRKGVENLARALKETPGFGGEETQQDVGDKLRHLNSMLAYLEASRYKVHGAMADLDARPKGNHPLALHIHSHKDKQGMLQSVLRAPGWLKDRSDLSPQDFATQNGSSPDWTDRGTADGNSVQPDSDFDEFSSEGSEEGGVSMKFYKPPSSIAPSVGQCRVLYDYKANIYDELTIKPGDVINIHDKQADGWWLGELNGVIGIFPATYVEEVE